MTSEYSASSAPSNPAPWLPTAAAPAAEPAPQPGPEPARSRNRPRWVIPTALLVGGLVIGGGLGAGVTLAVSDPTRSEEYLSLEDDLDAAQSRISSAERAAKDSAADAQRAEDAAEEQAAELAAREADVDAREAAVDAIVNTIVATSIENGTWTVGRDIEPGTYRTAEPVSSQCYWGIYRSGSNGSDIIDNDIVDGGYPTVQLSAGQDFENSGCGTFIKQ